eukprot:5892173-Heterocapsa_arctica.AAC.1
MEASRPGVLAGERVACCCDAYWIAPTEVERGRDGLRGSAPYLGEGDRGLPGREREASARRS